MNWKLFISYYLFGDSNVRPHENDKISSYGDIMKPCVIQLKP